MNFRKKITICPGVKMNVSKSGVSFTVGGKGISANQDVYSSDSTPFADKGVPAISFARLAPGNTAPIHNRYDTLSVMKAEHMQEDIEFVLEFAKRMANSACCPVARKMPDNMKDKLDLYLCRKRGK